MGLHGPVGALRPDGALTGLDADAGVGDATVGDAGVGGAGAPSGGEGPLDDAGWLALREPADDAARAGTAGTLLRPLADALAARAGAAALQAVDVGAGTGAGARWLQRRLPLDGDWRLLDVDAGLLARASAPHGGGRWRAVAGSVTDLPALLAAEPADLVSCQALLDLLTQDELEALLCAAAGCGVCVLLGLTVTGEVGLHPAHAADAEVAAAFDAHQRRGGRMGPGAADVAGEVLGGLGYAVTVAPTPWRLDARQDGLLGAWLEGRAAAAAEQQPALAHDAGRWLAARRDALAAGRLEVVVGHVDVLGLPSERVGSGGGLR